MFIKELKNKIISEYLEEENGEEDDDDEDNN